MTRKKHQSENCKDKTERVRLYWQLPNRVLRTIGLKEGMAVVDFGSGTGYFTFKIARQVGKSGKVYAVDQDGIALQKLKDSAEEESFKNICTVKNTEMQSFLPEGEIDRILMVNVLHLLDAFGEISAALKKCLKPKGVLVVVQWDAEKMDQELEDWDEANRKLFTQRTTLRRVFAAGWEVFRIDHFLPMQNIYLCQPADVDQDDG